MRKVNALAPDEGASIALDVTKIIRSHLIVGIWSNEVAQNNLRNAIDDYFFDVLWDTMQIELPMEQLDDLEQRVMDIARARFAASAWISAAAWLAAKPSNMS